MTDESSTTEELVQNTQSTDAIEDSSTEVPATNGEVQQTSDHEQSQEDSFFDPKTVPEELKPI